MKFRFDGTNTIAISLSQKPESERNKFSHFKIFRWLKRSLIFAWSFFSSHSRVGERSRESSFLLHRTTKLKHTDSISVPSFFLLLIQLGEKEFHGSTSISMIHFWRESKAMSRRKSIIVKFFYIDLLNLSDAFIRIAVLS
jgi:hypothetical protein